MALTTANLTATTTFQTLADLIIASGQTDIGNAVTSDIATLLNNSGSVDLYVGTGTNSPTAYTTVTPNGAYVCEKGMNTNEVWLASASSTVAVDFAEGATFQPPTFSGTVAAITASDGDIPFVSSGDLAASGVAGDGLTKVYPSTNDGIALGDTTHNFSDLFLATGAVLNYANGNVAVTHSSGILTMGTGELRITTPGTNAASVPTLGSTSTFTNKTLTSPAINTPTINGGAAMGATSTEIDQLNDVSAYTETVSAAGAVSVTKVLTNLEVASGGAVTLAAPSATMYGQQKTICMTVDDGDVTLALTNVVGQSSGTTATFDTAGGALVLLALPSAKWVVVKEFGITLS